MNTLSTNRQAGAREGTVLVLGSSLTIMGSVMIAPMIPKMMAHFAPHDPGASIWVPLAVTGPALAIALFAPAAGWLADRLGRKRLLILATIFYALLGALPALLNHLLVIVGVRFAFGLCEAMIMTCCATLIADYWRGEQRMRYVNRQVVTIAVVGSLFFVVGGVFGEHSWRIPFYLYLLPLLLVPAMIKMLWEPLARSDAEPGPGVEAGGDRLRPGVLVVGYALVLVGMVLTFVVTVQVPSLLVAMGVTSSGLIGLATGLSLLASLVGALSWRIARGRLGTAGCNALLLALMAIGLWVLTRARHYDVVMIAVTIHGIGAGLLVPNAMAPVMGALTTSTRGRGMGGFTACLYVGQFVSPLVVAGLAGIVAGLTHAIAALAAFSLALALVWALAELLKRGGRYPNYSEGDTEQTH